jgi:uncharacterized protein YjbJ (UPF0337 family)
MLVMNWDEVSGNWKKARGRIREEWGMLTDDDLDMIQGGREELIGRIQQRYGMEREDAERAVREWLSREEIHR